MTDLHERLEKKGWSEKEVQSTLRALEEGERRKSSFVLKLDVFVFWLFLILAITGTFVVSVVLVPILVIMQGIYLYGMLAVMGVFFGVLLNSAVVHLLKVQTRPLIMPNIFLPAIALINVYIITHFSNDLIELLKLPTLQHSPALVSLVYVIAFMIPYAVWKIRTPSSFPSAEHA